MLHFMHYFYLKTSTILIWKIWCTSQIKLVIIGLLRVMIINFINYHSSFNNQPKLHPKVFCKTIRLITFFLLWIYYICILKTQYHFYYYFWKLYACHWMTQNFWKFLVVYNWIEDLDNHQIIIITITVLFIEFIYFTSLYIIHFYIIKNFFFHFFFKIFYI